VGVGQGAVEGLVSLRDRPVLVTGHTGFKGGWLALWLATLGARVHGYALAPPTQPNLFDVAGVDRVLASDTRADLADLATMTATLERFRPEIVFHLAAQPLVREGYRDPLGTLATNVLGTAHVLEATRAVDSVRAVVVVATDKVYQNVETGHAFSEVDPLGGHDPYSGSKAAAEIAEAHEFIIGLPEGYDTIVGERGQKLSGGQRQRISIARAVLIDPAILVLDEATSAVDNETEAAIQRSLERISHDRTTMVIAHRLSTIRHADRIYVLDAGKVAEVGTHEELLALGGIYRALWDVQTGEAVRHEAK